MRALRVLGTTAFAAAAAALLAPSAQAQVGGCPLAPGVNTNCTVQTSDGMRSFDVLVPQNVGRNAPVLIDFHGGGATKEGQRRSSGLAQLVQSDGVVLILPQGLAGGTWNGQTCCGQAFARGIDDVAMARAAVTAVSAQLGIQPAVRASSGISNGMAISNRIACEAGDFFDLVAGVSFQLAARGGAAGLRANCAAAPGTVYSEFHATADNVIPFAGGGSTLNAAEAPRVLAQIRGCDANPQQSRLNSNTTCQTFSGCDGGGLVQMCTVTPGSHVLYPLVGQGDEQPDFAAAFRSLLQEATRVNRRGIRAADLPVLD